MSTLAEDTLLGIAILRALLKGDTKAIEVLMNSEEAARALVAFGLGVLDAYLAVDLGRDPNTNDYLDALDRMTAGIQTP